MRLLFAVIGLLGFSLSAIAANEWLYYKEYPWVYDAKSQDWLYLRGAADGSIYAYRNSTKEWEVFTGSGTTNNDSSNNDEDSTSNDKTWDEQYAEWIKDPEPYGGLEVLQKIKEAKDSGATHLNLTWDGDGNKITDISPLAELTTLVNLHIVGHNVSELKPLAGLTNLKSLSLNVNEISDISPLAGLTNLTTLEIPRNRITDVTPLADLIKLSSLFIYSNNISDITQLSGLTKMFHLRIDHNNISDISSLMGMSNLMTIDIRSNPISDSQKDILRNAFPYANIDL